MNAQHFCVITLVLLATATLAETPPESELVPSEGRGRWTFSAGPSWRSRVKMETSGAILAPDPVQRSTSRRDMTDSRNWKAADAKSVSHPNAGTEPLASDAKLWGLDNRRTEIYGTVGRNYIVNATDEERPLGLNLQACYDVYQAETWSVALGLRFAGYWGMESSSRGYYDAGTKLTETWIDHYVFPEESPDAPFAPHPQFATIVDNGSTLKSSVLDTCGSRMVSTRLRSDLYQIGFGPRVTWSPFAGWCDCMSWLDVYGGVEVLCNIAYSRFDADGASSSSTDCLIGFGGNVGFVGNITDWLGIYGQVGYEWVDGTEVSTGGFDADIDYSSLVLSAGVQFRF